MTDADRRLDEWLRGLKWSLESLPQEDREDILQETRAHIGERLDGGAVLEEVLAGFGTPERYARSFVDEREVRSALGGGRAVNMVGVVARRLNRSLVAVLGLFGLLLAGALAFAGLAVMFYELTDPAHTGFWVNDHGSAFLGTIDDPATATDLLGWKVYPAGIGLIAAGLIAARFILVATVRSFAPRR